MNKRKMFMNILWFLPKKTAHKMLYKYKLNKELNLKNPQDFNEKIQYLIVNKYGKKEGMLSDKFRVKEYVENLKIADLYIPKLYKTYTNVEDIKIEELPEKFVLKCNNGSGGVYICKDKEKFDIDEAKKGLSMYYKKNYAKQALEYHYGTISPVIIAEEYLDDNINKNPLDYKFYCFNGHAESILVCSERDKKLRLDDFDLNWNKLDYTLEKYKSNFNIEKPQNLDKMIKIAEELSKDIPFVRIDLYEINGKIYFGEYSFTPAAGLIYYYKQNALNILGSKIKI